MNEQKRIGRGAKGQHLGDFFISVILKFQRLNINHTIGIVSEFSKWQDCAHSTLRNESYLRAKPTGSKKENH